MEDGDEDSDADDESYTTCLMASGMQMLMRAVIISHSCEGKGRYAVFTVYNIIALIIRKLIYRQIYFLVGSMYYCLCCDSVSKCFKVTSWNKLQVTSLQYSAWLRKSRTCERCHSTDSTAVTPAALQQKGVWRKCQCDKHTKGCF